MKIFQIYNDICYWDATLRVGNLAFAAEHYAPDIVFVEAPDYVFEGWGYNKYETGDACFVKPVPPLGWLYDESNGTFYPDGQITEPYISETMAQVRSILDEI